MKEVKFTWAEVYQAWRIMTLHMPTLNDSIPVTKIKVNQWKMTDSYFYGLDWIRKEAFDQRVDYVANRTTSFMLSGNCLNKGTLATLEFLIEADSDETRAAIWIYAFTRDVTEHLMENWRGEGYRIIRAIEMATLLYLKGKGIEWYHAMKKLLPDICFPYELLDSIKVNDIRVFISLAAIAADYVQMHYKAVEYDSRQGGDMDGSASYEA